MAERKLLLRNKWKGRGDPGMNRPDTNNWAKQFGFERCCQICSTFTKESYNKKYKVRESVGD
jgi:hypothetical protein